MPVEVTLVEIAIDADIEAADGFLSALQQTLVTRLEQEQGDEDDDHYPSALSILYEQKLGIAYEINRIIGSIGMCVDIMTPGVDDRSPNIPVVCYDNVSIIAQVIENPVINQATGGMEIPGGLIAERIAGDLKRTIVSGTHLVVTDIRQRVNEQQGLVLWNVGVKYSD